MCLPGASAPPCRVGSAGGPAEPGHFSWSSREPVPAAAGRLALHAQRPTADARGGDVRSSQGGRVMEARWRELCDDLGPEKILLVRDAAAGLEGVVVVDNVAAGPAIGGVRMAPDVTVGEVVRLARAMTFKNAAAGLPHGGGKAGILADPAMGRAGKERLIRSFARAIRTLTEYVPGPDMGTDEACMGWVHDEIGRAG